MHAHVHAHVVVVRCKDKAYTDLRKQFKEAPRKISLEVEPHLQCEQHQGADDSEIGPESNPSGSMLQQVGHDHHLKRFYWGQMPSGASRIEQASPKVMHSVGDAVEKKYDTRKAAHLRVIQKAEDILKAGPVCIVM